jgi:hypothetical protein
MECSGWQGRCGGTQAMATEHTGGDNITILAINLQIVVSIDK